MNRSPSLSLVPFRDTHNIWNPDRRDSPDAITSVPFRDFFCKYEIWRRHGDEGPWGIIATTRKQAFADTPVTPGQYYEYKVRAVAAKSTSNYSNSAVVYGAP
jgi:hypothetical protein